MKTLTDEQMGELYSTRLLVFLEEHPQTNKYRQVMLTQEQFKKVSLTVTEKVGMCENGLEKVEINMTEELFTLPDLPEIYEIL